MPVKSIIKIFFYENFNWLRVSLGLKKYNQEHLTCLHHRLPLKKYLQPLKCILNP